MSATHAVQATRAWLQERNIDHEKLLHQMSTAAVTPGATARVEAAFVLLDSAQESVAILLAVLHAVIKDSKPCSPI